MENKFTQNFYVKKQANIGNLDYKYPHQEMAEFLQKTLEEKEKANKQVLDIMYQMMYDEKRFRLDQKTDEIMGNSKDMNATRSELLAKVAADLEAAKKMSKQPNFRLKEMNDLIEGKSTPQPRKDTISAKIDLLSKAD